MHYVEHHAAHLASSFFASPVRRRGGLRDRRLRRFRQHLDGRSAAGTCIAIQNRVFFPHSLGLLYLALTQFLGFPKYGDEFKVMGLAPYGEPSFVDKLRQLVRVGEHGELCLDLSYFTHWSGGMTMTWDDGEPAIGPRVHAEARSAAWPRAPAAGSARRRGTRRSRRRCSASTRKPRSAILRALHARVRNPRLCLAGGCAMNSVANGKIRSETPFTDVYIQPAAGDNGTALGAALHVWHQLGGPRRFQMRHGYWGPEFDDAAIAAGDRRAATARSTGVSAPDRASAARNDLCEWTATRIADGKVVGWFQGRMEWGARALGNRSIVADPRRRDMREIINVAHQVP